MLAVGWELSESCELWASVPLHVVLSVGCLGFLMTWWLGSVIKCPSREEERGSCIAFYDIDSEVTNCHSHHSHVPEEGDSRGGNRDSRGGNRDPTSQWEGGWSEPFQLEPLDILVLIKTVQHYIFFFNLVVLGLSCGRRAP